MRRQVCCLRLGIEERGELVATVVAMERAQQSRGSDEKRKYDAAVALERKQAAEAFDQDQLQHAIWRERGMYGMAVGFGMLIVMSLFLAFLAMERHLRLLQRFVGAAEARGEVRREGSARKA
jgi:hypothetical protein